METALGRSVRFLVDPCQGAAGKCSPDGIITLRPDSTLNPSVIGEEIMHLHRRKERYPVIKPGPLAAEEQYADAVNCLSGHFEEYAFFSFLEGLELDPRSVLTPTIEESVQRLPEMLPRIEQTWSQAAKRVVLATLFVQASVIAPESPATTRLLQMFDTPRLSVYAQLGRFLSDEVRAARNEAQSQVAERMQRCVARLELSPDAAIVTIVPLSTASCSQGSIGQDERAY